MFLGLFLQYLLVVVATSKTAILVYKDSSCQHLVSVSTSVSGGTCTSVSTCTPIPRSGAYYKSACFSDSSYNLAITQFGSSQSFAGLCNYSPGQSCSGDDVGCSFYISDNSCVAVGGSSAKVLVTGSTSVQITTYLGTESCSGFGLSNSYSTSTCYGVTMLKLYSPNGGNGNNPTSNSAAILYYSDAGCTDLLSITTMTSTTNYNVNGSCNQALWGSTYYRSESFTSASLTYAASKFGSNSFAGIENYGSDPLCAGTTVTADYYKANATCYGLSSFGLRILSNGTDKVTIVTYPGSSSCQNKGYSVSYDLSTCYGGTKAVLWGNNFQGSVPAIQLGNSNGRTAVLVYSDIQCTQLISVTTSSDYGVCSKLNCSSSTVVDCFNGTSMSYASHVFGSNSFVGIESYISTNSTCSGTDMGAVYYPSDSGCISQGSVGIRVRATNASTFQIISYLGNSSCAGIGYATSYNVGSCLNGINPVVSANISPTNLTTTNIGTSRLGVRIYSDSSCTKLVSVTASSLNGFCLASSMCQPLTGIGYYKSDCFSDPTSAFQYASAQFGGIPFVGLENYDNSCTGNITSAEYYVSDGTCNQGVISMVNGSSIFTIVSYSTSSCSGASIDVETFTIGSCYGNTKPVKSGSSYNQTIAAAPMTSQRVATLYYANGDCTKLQSIAISKSYGTCQGSSSCYDKYINACINSSSQDYANLMFQSNAYVGIVDHIPGNGCQDGDSGGIFYLANLTCISLGSSSVKVGVSSDNSVQIYNYLTNGNCTGPLVQNTYNAFTCYEAFQVVSNHNNNNLANPNAITGFTSGNLVSGVYMDSQCTIPVTLTLIGNNSFCYNSGCTLASGSSYYVKTSCTASTFTDYTVSAFSGQPFVGLESYSQGTCTGNKLQGSYYSADGSCLNYQSYSSKVHKTGANSFEILIYPGTINCDSNPIPLDYDLNNCYGGIAPVVNGPTNGNITKFQVNQGKSYVEFYSDSSCTSVSAIFVTQNNGYCSGAISSCAFVGNSTNYAKSGCFNQSTTSFVHNAFGSTDYTSVLGYSLNDLTCGDDSSSGIFIAVDGTCHAVAGNSYKAVRINSDVVQVSSYFGVENCSGFGVTYNSTGSICDFLPSPDSPLTTTMTPTAPTTTVSPTARTTHKGFSHHLEPSGIFTIFLILFILINQ